MLAELGNLDSRRLVSDWAGFLNLYSFGDGRVLRVTDPSGLVPIACSCDLYDERGKVGNYEKKVECAGLASNCCRGVCTYPGRWSGSWSIVGAAPDDLGALCKGDWKNFPYWDCLACCLEHNTVNATVARQIGWIDENLTTSLPLLLARSTKSNWGKPYGWKWYKLDMGEKCRKPIAATTSRFVPVTSGATLPGKTVRFLSGWGAYSLIIAEGAVDWAVIICCACSTCKE